MTEALITKYRPRKFEEVVGHSEIIAALQRVIASQTRPHVYLLTGPAGTGKTTLARIIADSIEADVIEVDAASQSSVDAARDLIDQGQYYSLTGRATKMFIVDEFHGLSRQASDALLKTLEEPPDHLYFALCTTEAHRVKETITSRSYHVPLKPLRNQEIEDLLTVVSELEEWQVDGDVFQMVVQAATGQPRKALSLLQSCHDAPSREEAKRIIALQEVSEPVMDLLRDIVSGKRQWSLVRPYLDKIDDDQFAGLVEQAGRYLANGLIREENEQRAQAIWRALDAIVFPTSTFDKKSAFIAAIGRLLWA